MTKNPKKIVVGLSGGVDSSTSAALLQKKGYAVTGIFLLTRDGADTRDVKKVCAILGIPLEIVDARKRFRRSVIDYFLKEYAAGRTPNPCVFCNENFKFKILFEIADALGAEYVATGHYARLKREFPISNFQFPIKSKIQNPKSKTILKLYSAKDGNKDQSYFLYRLRQEELARIIFPLGNYEKSEVRKLAKEFKLPVHDKAESQDVCFLAGLTAEEFLKKHLKKLKRGKIMDQTGKILGEHQGLALYTLGQRRGINIGGTGPYYVLAKNYKKNSLIVTNDQRQLPLFSRAAILNAVVFPAGKPAFPAKVLARTRYRNPLVYATIKPRNAEWETRSGEHGAECEIEFEKPQRAVTPGQSCVFYDEEGGIIGGGIIK